MWVTYDKRTRKTGDRGIRFPFYYVYLIWAQVYIWAMKYKECFTYAT